MRLKDGISRKKQQVLDEDERRARKELRLEFDRILKMKEAMWRQKSRVQWLKGDNNTTFFHKMANAYQALNNIDVFQVEGYQIL